ncbi:MAG: mannonate dehydratase [Acidobacteria bacterium]|nr:mannonate dehydratase [Acidobacteriota bacterium]
MIQLAELFEPGDASRMRLAAQAGVTHGIARLMPVLAQTPRDLYSSVLLNMREELQTSGLIFAGVESHPVPAEKIKLGLPGRDQEIENYIAILHALAEIDVRLVCYNWMAGLGWYRTRLDAPERQGALVSEFSQADAEAQGPTHWGVIPEAQIWANLEYFLSAILPVAESLGIRMALHPDDPPISPLRGIGRILTSADAFRRVLALHPGPANGITFCQANFQLMGEDIAALAREWCAAGRLYFIHLRDVSGTRTHFRETFHDNGPTNLAAMLEVYLDANFHGPLRPDHAPTMEGESNHRPGYGITGKVFAAGYIRGILDALQLQRKRSC